MLNVTLASLDDLFGSHRTGGIERIPVRRRKTTILQYAFSRRQARPAKTLRAQSLDG